MAGFDALKNRLAAGKGKINPVVAKARNRSSKFEASGGARKSFKAKGK